MAPKSEPVAINPLGNSSVANAFGTQPPMMGFPSKDFGSSFNDAQNDQNTHIKPLENNMGFGFGAQPSEGFGGFEESFSMNKQASLGAKKKGAQPKNKCRI